MNKTEVLSIRVTADEAKMLEEEAQRRGFAGTSPFVRQLILDSVVLSTPANLILETVLATQRIVLGLAAKYLDCSGVKPA